MTNALTAPVQILTVEDNYADITNKAPILRDLAARGIQFVVLWEERHPDLGLINRIAYAKTREQGERIARKVTYATH